MKFCAKATGNVSAAAGKKSCIVSAAAMTARSSSAAWRSDADLSGFMALRVISSS
jgi:hypothetical protein